jgi:hypothetical protein
MGSIRKIFKKATRAVTRPASKVFKGVAKGILKVGKAAMKGVAKLNKKLGPIGSIALAVAMPYALSGLSGIIGHGGMAAGQASGLMGSQNAFLRAIGTVGNQIRTGYQAFNTGISKSFSTITDSISKGFRKFAPKNLRNTYSEISQGAKNLFNSAKKVTQKYSPIKGKQGTLTYQGQVPGGGTAPMTIDSSTAAKYIENSDIGLNLDVFKEQLKAGEIKQTLGSDKWFVQGSRETDKIITDTINDAYKSTYDSFSPNAKKYFNDLKTRAKDIKTYVNDAELGSAVENSVGVSKSYATDFSQTPYNIDIDFSKTKDYVEMPNGGYKFTGDKTFSAEPVKEASKSLTKSITKSATGFLKDSLLADTPKVDPYYMPIQDMTTQTTIGQYGGTDITGAQGGDFFTKVYGEDAGTRMKNYYKNMNLIGSMVI